MIWPREDNRQYFLPLFVSLVALAWLALGFWGQSPHARFLRHDELQTVGPRGSAEGVGIALLFVVGWTVMTAAMMLPTSLPLFDLFRRLVRKRPNASRLVVLLIAGYLVVWSAFGLTAHVADWGIHALVARAQWLADDPWVLVSGVLILAGLYQFSSLKYLCLEKCRSPLSFITEHWHGRSEHLEAFGLGVHHGLFCVGCCWSLMLLMFAVGVGSLGWMLALGSVMAVEKNMPWGRRISAPLGVALVASGITVPFISAREACAHLLC